MRCGGLAQRLANCVTELLPERALKRAAERDEYLAAHEKPIGPLHGLPISVKEHVGIKGLDLNAGFVGWVGNVAKEDALLLQSLWDADAVFYVRTTQPQTLMHLEMSNNLYKGFSGGEGALISLPSLVLGVGSDIGGSIRSPAANRGIFWLQTHDGPPTDYIFTENPQDREYSTRSLWDAIIARQDYRAKYASLWNETAEASPDGRMVDVMLCPGGPGVAPKLDTAKYWGYTSQWNLLDYPAIVFPINDCASVEKDGITGSPEDYQPLN
ncbi:hypothetical protein DL767_003115 [Monosporascus sp. MG133]|nr:hypothetical protein DL767_003115 [Monosporascus sp. MG133]